MSADRYRLIPVDFRRYERILTRSLMFNGCIETMQLIVASEEGVAISAFDCETANTVFMDGILLLLDQEAVTPGHMAVIRDFLSRHAMDKDFMSCLCRKIDSIGLFGDIKKGTGKLALYQLTR